MYHETISFFSLWRIETVTWRAWHDGLETMWRFGRFVDEEGHQTYVYLNDQGPGRRRKNAVLQTAAEPRGQLKSGAFRRRFRTVLHLHKKCTCFLGNSSGFQVQNTFQMVKNAPLRALAVILIEFLGPFLLAIFDFKLTSPPRYQRKFVSEPFFQFGPADCIKLVQKLTAWSLLKTVCARTACICSMPEHPSQPFQDQTLSD